MNFLNMFVDYKIIGILKLFTLSQNPSSCLYSIKQIIFSLSNYLCHRYLSHLMGVGLQNFKKKPCVETCPGSYFASKFLLHIICSTFVNCCKLLNTKTAYFLFIKTKIKLLSLFPKTNPKVNSP